MPDPFITQQDLTDYLGRDVTADNGALMACDAACDMIRDITEQDFNAETTTITLDGTGTDGLVLQQQPATRAGTVLVNGGTITDYMLSGQGLLLRGTAGSNPRPLWPLGRQNVQVTYDHGYTLTPTNNVPRSIRMVALSIAARLVVQGAVQSETVGDVTVDYGMAASDLTVNELRILAGYLQTRSF
jgi:hypothetical protein